MLPTLFSEELMPTRTCTLHKQWRQWEHTREFGKELQLVTSGQRPTGTPKPYNDGLVTKQRLWALLPGVVRGVSEETTLRQAKRESYEKTQSCTQSEEAQLNDLHHRLRGTDNTSRRGVLYIGANGSIFWLSGLLQSHSTIKTYDKCLRKDTRDTQLQRQKSERIQ